MRRRRPGLAVTHYEDIRVVFEVPRPQVVWRESDKDAAWLASANDIRDQIVRHVDDVGRRGNRVSVRWDGVCIYCGSDPEQGIPTAQPQCCDKAVSLWFQWLRGGYASPRVCWDHLSW